MRLAYLYHKSTTYPHKQELLQAFKESETVDIAATKSLNDKEIYIVELSEVDRVVSKKLIDLFEKTRNPFIYFIIPKDYSLLLIQLAFFLKAQAIITHTQEPKSVITKIKTEQKQFAQNILERYVGSVVAQTQHFVVCKKKQLFYVSEALLHAFGCRDMDSFDDRVMHPQGLYALLEKESSLSVPFGSDGTKEYRLSTALLSEDDTIINFSETKKLNAPTSTRANAEATFISSRVAFIEQLKESILQKNISEKSLSLLSINFTDIKKLLLLHDLAVVEEILRELLIYIESSLQGKLIFSQFQHHFYVVLFEDKNFQELNAIAQEFHSKLIAHMEHKKIELPVELYSFSLDSQGFSDVLKTLEAMASGAFKLDEAHGGFVEHYSNKNSITSEKKLLDDAFKKGLKLKILNIYNGLVINTSAKILKVTDSSIYISFESLQGVVLNLEKQTVLQSEYFFQDIHAVLKNISLTKKLAILENFKFLKTNANSRKYARVTTATKMPAHINIHGQNITGSILDLSIKSLAIQIKNARGNLIAQKG